jgi:type IV pilus assembly protein PilZ
LGPVPELQSWPHGLRNQCTRQLLSSQVRSDLVLLDLLHLAIGGEIVTYSPASGSMPKQKSFPLPSGTKCLFNAYMPFVKGGGLFVPTSQRYNPGDEVFILLSLMDEKDRLPVAGKVIWITPPGAQGNRTAGIGVQFSESSDGDAARTKIETILAGILGQERATHTM